MHHPNQSTPDSGRRSGSSNDRSGHDQRSKPMPSSSRSSADASTRPRSATPRRASSTTSSNASRLYTNSYAPSASRVFTTPSAQAPLFNDAAAPPLGASTPSTNSRGPSTSANVIRLPLNSLTSSRPHAKVSSPPIESTTTSATTAAAALHPFSHPASPRFYPLEKLVSLQHRLLEAVRLLSITLAYQIEEKMIPTIHSALRKKGIYVRAEEARLVPLLQKVAGLTALQFVDVFRRWSAFCNNHRIFSLPILPSLAILWIVSLPPSDRLMAALALEAIRSATSPSFLGFRREALASVRTDAKEWAMWDEATEQAQWTLWSWASLVEVLRKVSTEEQMVRATRTGDRREERGRPQQQQSVAHLSGSMPQNSNWTSAPATTNDSDSEIEIIDFVPLSVKAQGKQRAIDQTKPGSRPMDVDVSGVFPTISSQVGPNHALAPRAPTMPPAAPTLPPRYVPFAAPRTEPRPPMQPLAQESTAPQSSSSPDLYADLTPAELEAERKFFESAIKLQNAINGLELKRGKPETVFEPIDLPTKKKNKGGEEWKKGAKATAGVLEKVQKGKVQKGQRKPTGANAQVVATSTSNQPLPPPPPARAPPRHAPPPAPYELPQQPMPYIPAPRAYRFGRIFPVPKPLHSYVTPSPTYSNYFPSNAARDLHPGLIALDQLRKAHPILLTAPSYTPTPGFVPFPTSKTVLASPRQFFNDLTPFIPLSTQLIVQTWQLRAEWRKMIQSANPTLRIDDRIMVEVVTRQRVKNDLKNLPYVERPTRMVREGEMKGLLERCLKGAQKAELRGEIGPMRVPPQVQVEKLREVRRQQVAETRALGAKFGGPSSVSVVDQDAKTNAVAAEMARSRSSTPPLRAIDKAAHVAATSLGLEAARPATQLATEAPPSTSKTIQKVDKRSERVVETTGLRLNVASPAVVAEKDARTKAVAAAMASPSPTRVIAPPPTRPRLPGTTSGILPTASLPKVTTLTPSSPALSRSNSTGTARNVIGKDVHPLLHFYTGSTPQQRLAVANLIAKSPRGSRPLQLAGGESGSASASPSMPSDTVPGGSAGQVPTPSPKAPRSALGLSSLPLTPTNPVEELPPAPASIQRQVDARLVELEDKVKKGELSKEMCDEQVKGLNEILIQARTVEKHKLLQAAQREARREAANAATAASTSTSGSIVDAAPAPARSTESTPRIEPIQIILGLNPAVVQPQPPASDPALIVTLRRSNTVIPEREHEPIPEPVAVVAFPLAEDLASPTPSNHNEQVEEEVDQLESDTDEPPSPHRPSPPPIASAPKAPIAEDLEVPNDESRSSSPDIPLISLASREKRLTPFVIDPPVLLDIPHKFVLANRGPRPFG